MEERIIMIVFAVLMWMGIQLAYENELRRFMPVTTAAAIEKIRKYAGKVTIRRNRDALDRELYAGSVILKNMSIVRRETPLSADYIYENLMENSSLLKLMYSRMLSLYRSGKDAEAFAVPSEFIGPRAARTFGIILSKLDKLNPAELTEQMSIFQESMTESRATQAVKRNQRNSIIITSMAAISIFALLINFVVVVVFMDALTMLNNMFI